MLLLASAFFLTLLQCSNAQNQTSFTPADCKAVEGDAGVALDLVNRHRREGYVFGLFRVAEAHELHIGNSSILYLTVDVLETECSVLSRRHWESCEYSDLYSMDFGQCKIITYTNQLLKKPQLGGFNCTLSPVPPDLLECKDCPVKIEILEVTKQHKNIAAKALKKFNSESNHTNYFNVDKVEKISKLTASREGHVLGFSIKETNCSKSTPEADQALECDFLHDWHAHVGFCKARTISDTDEPDGTDISCEIYSPRRHDYGQRCRYSALGQPHRHPHHHCGHRHHHKHHQRHGCPPSSQSRPEDPEHNHSVNEEHQDSHEGPTPPPPHHGGPHHHFHHPHHCHPPPPHDGPHHHFHHPHHCPPPPPLHDGPHPPPQEEPQHLSSASPPHDDPHNPSPSQEELHHLPSPPPPPHDEAHHSSLGHHHGPHCPHPPHRPHHHHPPPHHGPHCPPPHGPHHDHPTPHHGPHCPPPHSHGPHHHHHPSPPPPHDGPHPPTQEEPQHPPSVSPPHDDPHNPPPSQEELHNLPSPPRDEPHHPSLGHHHEPHCPHPPHKPHHHHPPPHHGAHCPPPPPHGPHHHHPTPHHRPHCPPPHPHGPHHHHPPPHCGPHHPPHPHLYHHYYRHHCNKTSISGKYFPFQVTGAVYRIPVLDQKDSLTPPTANFPELAQSYPHSSCTGEDLPSTGSSLKEMLEALGFPDHLTRSKSCPGNPKLVLPMILPLFPHSSMTENSPT